MLPNVVLREELNNSNAEGGLGPSWRIDFDHICESSNASGEVAQDINIHSSHGFNPLRRDSL
jgi:hypothetical protein